MNLHFVFPGHPMREAVETLVREVYARQYGARVPAFPELMMTLARPEGTPFCAVGVRVGLGYCFSEAYLDDRVEAIISDVAGEPVPRTGILELSSLASDRIGFSFALLREVTRFARERGISWAVFTATRRLRRVMKLACLPVVELVPARPERLVDAEVWGSYYDNDPWVCALRGTASVPAPIPVRGHIPAATSLQPVNA